MQHNEQIYICSSQNFVTKTDMSAPFKADVAAVTSTHMTQYMVHDELLCFMISSLVVSTDPALLFSAMFVCRISQKKYLNRFKPAFTDGWGMGQGRIHNILVQIQSKWWVQELFFSLSTLLVIFVTTTRGIHSAESHLEILLLA